MPSILRPHLFHDDRYVFLRLKLSAKTKLFGLFPILIKALSSYFTLIEFRISTLYRNQTFFLKQCLQLNLNLIFISSCMSLDLDNNVLPEKIILFFEEFALSNIFNISFFSSFYRKGVTLAAKIFFKPIYGQ